MSPFTFSIFTGMSVLCIVFLLTNLLASFKTLWTLIFGKLKLHGANAFLTADTLGWVRNFIIAFKAGWEIHSAEKSIFLNSGIFKSFNTLEKNEINILTVSSLSVVILFSCTNVFFWEDFTLSDKKGFTVFRNLL